MAGQAQPPRRDASPSTSGDLLTGQWEQLRPQLRTWWDRLTEADLLHIGGQQDRLISVLQQRYGYPRERAQQEVERRFQEYHQRGGVVATASRAAQDMASTVAETAGAAASTAQEMAGAAASTAQEMAGAAVSAVTDTVAGAGTYVQEKGVQALPGDLAELIRRHPIPAVLIGIGVGILVGHTLARTGTSEGA